jgi:L-alanine-DL-glutamate epimerase-like enolase superfamily enzyme
VTIARVEAYNLANFPIDPPPFRELPKTGSLLLVEVETSDGITGWGAAGYAHPTMVHFVNTYVAREVVGLDPLHRERIAAQLSDPRPDSKFGPRKLGRMLTGAMAALDLALWDVTGKILGQPVHVLLGGASDKVPVYITHGAAYAGAPVYSPEDLAREAAELAKGGNWLLKNTVGRQMRDGKFAPDPVDDYHRMAAIREAVGPDVKIAMDGNCRMTVRQAEQLAKLCEPLDIEFFEEPVNSNDVHQLAALRKRAPIAIAAAENHLYSAADLIRADAIDILQPNVVNDGGYTAGVRNANLARAHNVPIGHGNGGGPYNIALHAGLGNGTGVEYHYHVWQEYNAAVVDVPQPEAGYVTASTAPGTGLVPKDGFIAEYAAEA